MGIGCGIGNEAIFLVNNGWNVWAIDSEPKAIQMIKNRHDITHPEELILSVAKFNNASSWENLPTVDFIYSVYALPFCNEVEFEKTWGLIMQHLNSGGRFAGHFFGRNYRGFTRHEMNTMTFLKREDVLRLFQDFELEYFQEIEENSLSGTGQPIHSHIFEVIAYKK